MKMLQDPLHAIFVIEQFCDWKFHAKSLPLQRTSFTHEPSLFHAFKPGCSNRIILAFDLRHQIVTLGKAHCRGSGSLPGLSRHRIAARNAGHPDRGDHPGVTAPDLLHESVSHL